MLNQINNGRWYKINIDILINDLNVELMIKNYRSLILSSRVWIVGYSHECECWKIHARLYTQQENGLRPVIKYEQLSECLTLSKIIWVDCKIEILHSVYDTKVMMSFTWIGRFDMWTSSFVCLHTHVYWIVWCSKNKVEINPLEFSFVWNFVCMRSNWLIILCKSLLVNLVN